VPASDECAMTDLVASVATAIPDRDEVAKTQRADLYFGPIITALQRAESARTLRHGNEYALNDRLLSRLPKGKSPDSARPRLCVPIYLIPTYFDFYPNSPSGGHSNGLRTYDRIRLLYFWPAMGNDIFKKCEQCHGCQSTRPCRSDRFGRMSSSLSSRPFERVSVDLVKLPKTKDGNSHFIAFIDEFCKEKWEYLRTSNKAMITFQM
jgi:Integrase zinc binding domain